MPSVVCPTCLRRNRVHRQSLGQIIFCKRCATSFVADQSGRTGQELLPGGSEAPGGWPRKAGWVLLATAAALAAWLLARPG